MGKGGREICTATEGESEREGRGESSTRCFLTEGGRGGGNERSVEFVYSRLKNYANRILK